MLFRLLAACAAACAFASPAFAATYDLVIDRTDVQIEGQTRRVFSINGQIAGPTLRWKEGEEVTINVINRLKEETSIHWHGVLVPFRMDGVAMVSFAGIKPGETFTYHFKVRQAGTYWYHSHSGGQEQEGMYAPIVIEPAQGERYKVARDYVVMLSDHHPLSPATILRKLKQEPGYFNDRRRTLPGLMRDLAAARTTEERQAIISPGVSLWISASHWTFEPNGPLATQWERSPMSMPAARWLVTGMAWTLSASCWRRVSALA